MKFYPFCSNIHYIDFEGHEHYYSLTEFPSTLEKKVKLLNYFRNYMKEHLLKAGANMAVRDGDELSRIPALKTWFRTSRAVVMHLTNGTVQVETRKAGYRESVWPNTSKQCSFLLDKLLQGPHQDNPLSSDGRRDLH